MTEGIAHLLYHPIDYAGLFPPAELSMEKAVDEYLELVQSDAYWLVNRFVCPAAQLARLAGELRRHGFESEDDRALDVTVIGTPLVSGANASLALANDLEQMKGYGEIIPSALEIKVAMGGELSGILGALKKTDHDAMGLDVYLEFGWGAEAIEAMHEAAGVIETVGFKARTGGVTADAFPDTGALAEFISTAISLDAPFKCTAGLHEPLRYKDPIDGAFHHGFLNVMLATAVAMEEDLSKQEIAEILEVMDPGQISFSDEGAHILDYQLSLEAIDEVWELFGGFGSCSVQEPLDGLRRHGWLR